MFSRRIVSAAARPARPSIIRPQSQLPRAQFSVARQSRATQDTEDPEVNGGYINPPRIKRQHRDPYGDWHDKQERRNWGEPVHEDNDILGIFSLHDYTHITPGRAGLTPLQVLVDFRIMWLGFLSCIGALSFAVYSTYPDRPAFPKEYEGGLDRELGGMGAVRAFKEGDTVDEKNFDM